MLVALSTSAALGCSSPDASPTPLACDPAPSAVAPPPDAVPPNKDTPAAMPPDAPPPATVHPTPLEAASALVGAYSGSWEAFGLDANGDVVSKSTWTDEVVAANPVVTKDRAYVTVTDTLSISGGGMFAVNFEEGFLLAPDGGVGDHYFTYQGTDVIERPIGAFTYAYETEVSSYDLPQIGIAAEDVVWAKHATTRVVTRAEGVDTDWITRVTTIQWKDAQAKVQGKQFVSMRGTHTRPSPKP